MLRDPLEATAGFNTVYSSRSPASRASSAGALLPGVQFPGVLAGVLNAEAPLPALGEARGEYLGVAWSGPVAGVAHLLFCVLLAGVPTYDSPPGVTGALSPPREDKRLSRTTLCINDSS